MLPRWLLAEHFAGTARILDSTLLELAKEVAVALVAAIQGVANKCSALLLPSLAMVDLVVQAPLRTPKQMSLMVAQAKDLALQTDLVVLSPVPILSLS
jgi:hypothetical protein